MQKKICLLTFYFWWRVSFVVFFWQCDYVQYNELRRWEPHGHAMIQPSAWLQECQNHKCKAIEENIWGGGKTVHVVKRSRRRARELRLPPLPRRPFPNWSVDISFKDDVTVILLLCVSFMRTAMLYAHFLAPICRFFNIWQFAAQGLLSFLKNCGAGYIKKRG